MATSPVNNYPYNGTPAAGAGGGGGWNGSGYQQPQLIAPAPIGSLNGPASGPAVHQHHQQPPQSQSQSHGQPVAGKSVMYPSHPPPPPAATGPQSGPPGYGYQSPQQSTPNHQPPPTTGPQTFPPPSHHQYPQPPLPSGNSGPANHSNTATSQPVNSNSSSNMNNNTTTNRGQYSNQYQHPQSQIQPQQSQQQYQSPLPVPPSNTQTNGSGSTSASSSNPQTPQHIPYGSAGVQPPRKYVNHVNSSQPPPPPPQSGGVYNQYQQQQQQPPPVGPMSAVRPPPQNLYGSQNQYPPPAGPPGGYGGGYQQQQQQPQQHIPGSGPHPGPGPVPPSGYPQANGYPGASLNQNWSNMWSQEAVNLLTEKNITARLRAHPPGNLTTVTEGNCSRDVMRCTLTKMPETAGLLQKSRLPLGILIHPFRDDESIPVISDSPIVRCRACRTYLNPFARVLDHRRWQCNVCHRVNDFPEEMLYNTANGVDSLSSRPDLTHGTVEYVASVEYMVRPPQPATYLFVFDCSRHAYALNYIPVLARTIADVLDDVPGDSRAQIGFIAFDSKVHFFTFTETQVIHTVAPDVNDIFIPAPSQILVTLDDHRDLIMDLLNCQLPREFSGPTAEVVDTGSALGPALQAAYKVVSPIGGRITLIQATLPNRGPSKEGCVLEQREDPNMRSTTKDSNITALLNPATEYYKKFSLDCSEHQVAVDVFNLSPYYSDLATVSSVAKFSGGSVYYYGNSLLPGATPSAAAAGGGGGGGPGNPSVATSNSTTSQLVNLARFESDLHRYLTRNIGFEAVMRLRCSRGLSIHTFHGNFFVRSTDLLALPNVNPDSAYGMQISIDEDLKDQNQICFQAAVLYTSPYGERRIRVHTLVLPVASTLPDVIAAADQEAVVGMLAKMAVDRSLTTSVSDAREALINSIVDLLQVYRNVNPSQACAGLVAPNTAALMPLYICALMKHSALRIGISTRIEDRVYSMERFKTLPLCHLMTFIYPNLYPVTNIGTLSTEEKDPAVGGESSESDSVSFAIPEPVQLSFSHIERNGVYLLDTYDHLYLYICKSVHPQWLADVFAVNSWTQIPDEGDTPPSTDQLIPLLELKNETSQRLRALIGGLMADRPMAPQVHILREDSRLRSSFLQYMVDDRNESSLSYYEFLQYIQQQLKS